MSGREVIDRYHRAIAVSNYDVVTALHAVDVVVWMSGRSIVSGRFHGREALFSHMTHHVLGPLDVTAEEYVKGVRVIVDDGDYVAVIFHGGLPNKTGGRYDQYYLQIFRIGDGLIQEIVEMFDTVMFEEAVAGHHRQTPRSPPASPFLLGPPIAGARDRDTMVRLSEAWQSAIAASDWTAAAALTSASCTLEIAGTTPLSGVALFDTGQLRDTLAGGVSWSRIACVDSNGAVLLMRGADPAYRQNYGIVLEGDRDRVGRISIFWDTAAVEASLFGNPMLPETTRSIMPSFDLYRAFVT